MIEESTFEDDVSRSCLVLSSHMENCFRETYGRLGHRIVGPLDPDKFDNASNKIQEIAIRTLLALGVALSVVCAGIYIAASVAILTAGSKVIRATGHYLQKSNEIHIRGKGEETSLSTPFSVMVWDAADTKSYPQGLRSWKSREDGFIDAIKQADPTILVLQGIDDPAHREKLIEELAKSYAHFYTHVKGDTSGLMLATKSAVGSFSYDTANSNLACIELKKDPSDTTPILRIVSGANASGEQLVETLTARELSLHTLFVGDSKQDLSHLLHPSFEEATHSDELAKQYKADAQGRSSTQNHISLVRYKDGLPAVENKLACLTSQIIRGFDEACNTQTAITDNHAIIVSLQFHS